MSVKVIPNLECIHTFQIPVSQGRAASRQNIVNTVAISPDQKFLIAGGDHVAGRNRSSQQKAHTTFYLWNLETGEPLDLFTEASDWPHSANIMSLAFTVDSSAIALGSSDQVYDPKRSNSKTSLSFWSVPNRPSYQASSSSTSAIFSIVSHPIERSFAAIDYQGNITLWHDYNETGELHEIKNWLAHPKRGYSAMTNLVVAFSHDGQTLYSAGLDKQIKSWCALTGDLIFELPQQEHCLRSLAISPDGETLVSSSDQRIRIWNAKTGELQHSFFGHPDWVRGLAITADSQFLLSTGDAKIKVWDLKTAQKLRTIPAHPAAIRGMAMSPDFSRIVTGGKDGTVKVWQVQA